MSFRPLRRNGVQRKRGTAGQAVQAKAQQSTVAATIRFVANMPRACLGRNALYVPAEKPGHALEKSSAAKGSGKRSESTAPRIAV